jgi:hypothetical protein
MPIIPKRDHCLFEKPVCRMSEISTGTELVSAGTVRAAAGIAEAKLVKGKKSQQCAVNRG